MVNEIIDGKYQIISKIGSGGTSVVYKAVRLADNKIVAIKIVREEFENDKENERHFYLEAEALYKMSHRNVRRILGIGQWNESLYMVNEFVDGKTLKDIIAEGNITIKEAVDYALQIAAGIEHAHRRDIIHRDIKPQNVIVSKDGTVKIVDFGIARMTSQTTRTMVGKDVVGSVHYISPEQAKGVQVDHRCDIYSFGILLYELFTGKVPFEGTEAVSIAMRHVNQIPEPPQSVNPKLPSGLNDIIVKCIQKDPEQRYQTAWELREDLLLYVANPDGFSVIKAENLQGRERIEEVSTVESKNKKHRHNSSIREDERHQRVRRERKSEERRTANNKKTIAVVCASVLLIALLVLSAVLISKFASSESSYEMRNVPNVSGRTKADATDILNDNNFFKTEFLREESNDFTEGLVVRTEPAMGENIPVSTKIKVYISMGPTDVIVENVVGKNEEEARSILTGQGLKVNAQYIEMNDIPAGTVISQSDASKTLKYGDSVTIEVSKQRAILKLVVPELKGVKTVDEAKNLITEAGFKVGEIKESPVTDETLGGVTGQRPLGGTEYSYANGSEPPVVKIDFNINVVKKTYKCAYEFETPEGDNKDFTLIIYNSSEELVGEREFLDTNRVSFEITGIEGESYRLELYVDNQLVDKQTLYAGN